MAKKTTIEDLKVAIDDLAMMTKRGFDQTASKDGLGKLEKRVDTLESLQKDMLEELQATHEDVRHIRTTVTMLVHSDTAHEAAITGLKDSVYRLEQKAGFAK